MQESIKFKPVRVKATTKESAIEQALQMTGAKVDQVEVDVLEEDTTGITVRVSPSSTDIIVDEPTEALVEDKQNADKEPQESSAMEVASQKGASAVAEDSNFSNSSSLASADAQQRACEVAQDLLQRMGLDADAKLADMPEGVGPLASSHPTDGEGAAGEFAKASLPRTFLNIEGEDVGILIGKHGQTLRAFQYLLNLSLNNSSSPEGVYVMVDAGDYRSRRAMVLEKAAQNAIERARNEHRAVRLDPMPAHERRLVHLILQEEKDLTTTSEGREPWRRVVVAPEGVRVTPSRHGGSHRRSSGGRGHRQART